MCMLELSLYKPEKGNDYQFMDRQIHEMFTVGGTDIFVHKYLGPNNPDEADALLINQIRCCKRNKHTRYVVFRKQRSKV